MSSPSAIASWLAYKKVGWAIRCSCGRLGQYKAGDFNRARAIAN